MGRFGADVRTRIRRIAGAVLLPGIVLSACSATPVLPDDPRSPKAAAERSVRFAGPEGVDGNALLLLDDGGEILGKAGKMLDKGRADLAAALLAAYRAILENGVAPMFAPGDEEDPAPDTAAVVSALRHHEEELVALSGADAPDPVRRAVAEALASCRGVMTKASAGVR
jgi:hypothetical protein